MDEPYTPKARRSKGFLDLPNELIIAICEELAIEAQPDFLHGNDDQASWLAVTTLNSLARTSRRLHEITEPFLYRTFRDNTGHFRRRIIIDTLDQKAELRKQLSNICYTTDYGDMDAFSDQYPLPYKNCMPDNRTMSELYSTVSPVPTQRQKTMNQIMEITALITSSRVGLRRLQLQPGSSAFNIWLFKWFNRAFHIGHELRSQFTSLRELAITVDGDAPQIAFAFALKLPALGMLEIRGATRRTQIAHPHRLSPVEDSPVKHLKLTHYFLTPVELFTMLDWFVALKSLHLELASSPYGGGPEAHGQTDYDLHLQEISQALLRHKDSMKNLKLTIHHSFYKVNSSMESPQSSLECLDSFPHLTSLVLPDAAFSFALLHGQPLNATLVDLLPSSLEHLDFTMHRPFSQVYKQCCHLYQHCDKDGKLPRLKRISLVAPKPWPNTSDAKLVNDPEKCKEHYRAKGVNFTADQNIQQGWADR